ncbi:MAG: PAS domain S-box protein [Proteobacteria bacterium]|nr:PAS domain S-box protein [Pseudomonadota bacterium]
MSKSPENNQSKKPQADALRVRAEEKLTRLPKIPESLSPEETRHMLQELRVHQIELEMQNEALKQSEKKLRKTIQSIDEGYYSVTLDGLLLDHNQAFNRVFGLDINHNLKGQNTPDFWQNPDDRKPYLDLLMEKGVVRNYQANAKKINGEPIFVLLNAHLVKDEKDERIRIEGMVSDITERRGTEAALAKSEEKFAKVFNVSPEAIAIASMEDGTYIEVNDVFLKLTGFQRDEVIGHTSREIGVWVHKRDMQNFREGLARNGFLRNLPVQYRMRSGEIRDFLVSSEIIELEGKPCSLNFIFDITERKMAEKALRKKDAMLENIASQVPGMLYQFMRKPDGTYSVPYSSHGIEAIFGCSPEDVRNDFDPIFNVIFPEDQDKIIQTIDASTKNLSQWMCEYRVQVPGEPIKWVFGNAIPEKMADGAIVWSGYNMDVTERKRAELEKTELETHLQQAQKIESVGRLAGGVAHDFNNMLGVILGYAELALDKVNRSESLYDDLMEIITAAERSAKITRQLLAFARKQTVTPKVMDLNATVAGMLNMLERLIGEDIHLIWIPEADLWPVKIDPSQIDQILANLCVNARDAIPGVGKITIETGNSIFSADYCAAHVGFVPGEWVRLSVRDDGRGMDQETLAHIFEPFFTTKGVGEGTGLGLAMIYGAVQQNNGFIDAHSAPEKGTIFSIYLPRYTGGNGPVLMDDASEQVRGGQETILIVEDESSVLAMTAKMLERKGYTVLTESVPGKAIQMAREHPARIHLLITDVIMPGMNGRDLWRQLSALKPDLKCLFMSGYTANVIANRGVLEEGAHFIQKPFVMKTLTAKVRETLDRK